MLECEGCSGHSEQAAKKEQNKHQSLTDSHINTPDLAAMNYISGNEN